MLGCALACVGAGAVLFSLLALIQKSLYSSAICLLFVLAQVAAFFYLLGAQILSFIQILVYAGAVMILLVVAIMAAPCNGRNAAASPWTELRVPGWLAGLILLLPFAELAAFYRLKQITPASLPRISFLLEQRMAGLLFGPYAVMTELVGLLILIAALVPLQENK